MWHHFCIVILSTFTNFQILNGLCLVGPVRRGAGGDVVGLCAAIEALGEPSPTQSSRPNTERLFQNRYADIPFYFR